MVTSHSEIELCWFQGASTYDAQGHRLRKDTSTGNTEYFYFGDEVIGEKNVASGEWTNYIYAGGRRIAKADMFKDEIAVQGTNTGAGQYTWWTITGAPQITVRSGDKLCFYQLQQGSSQGGMILTFSDGGNSSWGVQDQDGNYANAGTVTGQWHARTADLSQYAGRAISSYMVGNSSAAATGAWNIRYSDIAIISADGAVTPIYTGQNTLSFQIGSNSTPMATGLSAAVVHDSSVGANALLTTSYYHGDQIGSSRLMTAGAGWPVWQGTFLPFGEEYNPQITSNHYKFTGKERDTETGLDYFGARYYGNSLGRFITPDWAAKGAAVPYADFADPQSLNLYTYVRNIPTTNVDADGHCPWCPVVEEAFEEIASTPEGAAIAQKSGEIASGIGAGLAAGWAYTSGAAEKALNAFGAACGQTSCITDLPQPSGGVVKNLIDNSPKQSQATPPNPNGSKGAPDHQQTADEEAAKMGGDREVRVPTPGGEKGSRVIDAAKVKDGKVVEATQVIRPNKNGTPPAREVRAANDIKKATGVTPKLVPVRPIKPKIQDGQ